MTLHIMRSYVAEMMLRKCINKSVITNMGKDCAYTHFIEYLMEYLTK